MPPLIFTLGTGLALAQAPNPAPADLEGAPVEAAQATSCNQRTTSSQLTKHIDQANNDWKNVDIDAFVSHTDALIRDLPCIDDELIPPVAAQIHRTLGLRAFVDKDVLLSSQAFAASRALEPSYEWPSELVAKGNPVLQQYYALDTRGNLSPSITSKIGKDPAGWFAHPRATPDVDPRRSGL